MNWSLETDWERSGLALPENPPIRFAFIKSSLAGPVYSTLLGVLVVVSSAPLPRSGSPDPLNSSFPLAAIRTMPVGSICRDSARIKPLGVISTPLLTVASRSIISAPFSPLKLPPA